jgi:phage shock protein A
MHHQEAHLREVELQNEESRGAGRAVRAAVVGLEERLADARRRQQLLIVRHRAAHVRLGARRVLAVSPSSELVCSKFNRFQERLEQQVEELTAQAELEEKGNGLEKEIADLEQEQAISRDLEALKREAPGQ